MKMSTKVLRRIHGTTIFHMVYSQSEIMQKHCILCPNVRMLGKVRMHIYMNGNEIQITIDVISCTEGCYWAAVGAGLLLRFSRLCESLGYGWTISGYILSQINEMCFLNYTLSVNQICRKLQNRGKTTPNYTILTPNLKKLSNSFNILMRLVNKNFISTALFITAKINPNRHQ